MPGNTLASRTIKFEFCKFTCVHLTRFRLAEKQSAIILSELTHAHYREPVPLKNPVKYST